jgi:Rrf2 family transcriptional regulator, iron-sulfur cluster assembly transcription factor
MLSKSCMYGIQASVFLAGKRRGEFITIREISDELDISFYFLTKILQHLTNAEIMESYKGPKGGVRLNKNPGEITFMDIVSVIDGPFNPDECVLNTAGCGNLKPCEIQIQWDNLRKEIRRLLVQTTLAEAAGLSREIPDTQTVQDLI